MFEAKRKYIRFCSNSCSAQWRAKNFPLSETCFKAGESSWNAGTNVSGMSGKTHTKETKDLMRQIHSGENAPNWKGGITPVDYRERRRAEYKDWRKSCLDRDGYRCVKCGSNDNLEVDHIQPFATNPELRLDVTNGRTLCHLCHVRTDFHGASKGKQMAIFTGKQATLEATGEPFPIATNTIAPNAVPTSAAT